MAPEELLNHGSQFLGHGPRRAREAFGHVLRPGKLKALLEEKLKANALLKTPAPARQTETRQCRREREGERERERPAMVGQLRCITAKTWSCLGGLNDSSSDLTFDL